MSIKDCIRRSQQAGEITLEEAQRLERRFDTLFRELRSASAAKESLTREIEVEAAEKKRRALLTEAARQERYGELLAHRNSKGQQDIAEAFLFMHEHFGQAKTEDVEHRRMTILGGAHAKLDEVLYEFRRGWLKGDLRRRGGETKARLDNVVRELFGQGTGDEAAAQLAKAWTEVAEDLRQRFNAAGGAIGKLEKWGLPQWHDPEALLNFGREAWIEHIMPMLDRDRMRSALTGNRLADEDLRQSLSAAWNRITSDGWIDREPAMQSAGRGAVSSQHADHRFLHFKDGDAWLAYARDFGGGSDPFSAMMGHLSTMARDIAAMEHFGPNPEGMRTYLKQVVEKHAATVKPVDRIIAEKTAGLSAIKDKLAQKTQDVVDRIEAIPGEIRALQRKNLGKGTKKTKKLAKQLEEEFRDLLRRLEPGDEVTMRDAELDAQYQAARAELDAMARVPFAETSNPAGYAVATLSRADDMWAIMRGTANAPLDSRMANVLQSARNLVSAAALGSAQISALSDLASQKAARSFVNMPSSVTGIVADYVKFLGRDNRREAVRSGLILDSATHVMQQQARYAGSINTATGTGFLADRVISLQGLAAWTQAGKHAFGMGLQAAFSDHIAMRFAELPDLLRRTLERGGITDAEWDQIRAARLYEPEEGATFLRPNEIEGVAGQRLAEKYLAMILRETRYAVPEGTIQSQLTLKAGRPGSFIGEITRNFAQFKTFGVAVMMLHGGRVAREIGAGRGAQGALYAGSLLITGTLLGALALQLKEVAGGRDPRDVKDPAFWFAAMLQSGGLGIYGDFLFAGVNRFGGGLTGTVAGPLVGRLDQLRNRTVGNVAEAIEDGAPNNVGREAVATLRDWTPGGTLWYARLAYERIVLDQLQHLLDPDARAAFRRKVRQREKDYGNGFWWAPGESAPERAPDLGSAVGR